MSKKNSNIKIFPAGKTREEFDIEKEENEKVTTTQEANNEIRQENLDKQNKKETNNACEFDDEQIEDNQDLIDDEDVARDNIAEQKATQYLNLARQVQADFDNYRKRNLDSVASARLDGISTAVEAILPAIDVLNSALSQITDEASKQGIEMIKTKMEESIQKLGVEKIKTVGVPFDHNLHSAVMTDSNKDYEDDIVTEEFTAGYKLKNKVIRYAQVKVNKI